MRIPADPPKEEKQPREVAPVQFLTDRMEREVPEGIVHPSQNRNHVMLFDSDQQVLTYREEDEDEPTESDRDPLLTEVDPNALQGSALEP